MLLKDIENKFNLNDMQERACRHVGDNIVFSAPTGSGKTEATLLAIPDGSKVDYFLPTVSAADIMYIRLSNDFPSIKWGIKTSQMSENNHFNDTIGDITISCPDGKLIEYLNGGRKKTLQDVVVLDEFDNYPPMVKTALAEYLKDYPKTQVIVPSATLTDSEKSLFEKCVTIEYRNDLNIIKHKVGCVSLGYKYRGVGEVIKENPDKKIGIIMNSIKGMDEVRPRLPEKTLFLNSQTDSYDRKIIERKLYNNDFSVICSNDLISFSIDVNFDILIMEVSDKMSINLQRMGRNNRQNKNVDFTNLYLFYPDYEISPVPFVDEDIKEDNFIQLLNGSPKKENDIHNWKSLISCHKIDEWRQQLPEYEIPEVEDIYNYWYRLNKDGKDLNLRKVPIKFKYKFKKDILKYKNKVPFAFTVDTCKYFTCNEIPYSILPYDSPNLKSMCIVRIKGRNYKIAGKDGNSILIKKYNDVSWGQCPECGETVSEADFHFGYNCCYDCC